MFRALRLLASVQMKTLWSCHTNQIGTKCGRPVARTVASQMLRSDWSRCSTCGSSWMMAICINYTIQPDRAGLHQAAHRCNSPEMDQPAPTASRCFRPNLSPPEAQLVLVDIDRHNIPIAKLTIENLQR